jgi:hypothetical protein
MYKEPLYGDRIYSYGTSEMTVDAFLMGQIS